MFHRKTIAELQREAAGSELHRVLDARHLVLLGIGAIIGAGIFSLTGLAAAADESPGTVYEPPAL